MLRLGKIELETALALSEAAVTVLPVSGAELASGNIVGKVELRALGIAELDNVSDARLVDGIGGKFNCGRDIDVEVLEVTKLGGISGSFKPGRLVGPVDEDELKPEYCICCCNEGGIESPVGGRSNDCWGK